MIVDDAVVGTMQIAVVPGRTFLLCFQTFNVSRTADIVRFRAWVRWDLRDQSLFNALRNPAIHD